MSIGRRVLIVEDETLIAFLLEDMILDLGFDVAGVAHTLDAAMRAEPDSFDCAILDVNLNGVPVHPFADMLRARGTPFAYATGGSAIPEVHNGALLLQKPYHQESLRRVLERMTAA